MEQGRTQGRKSDWHASVRTIIQFPTQIQGGKEAHLESPWSKKIQGVPQSKLAI